MIMAKKIKNGNKDKLTNFQVEILLLINNEKHFFNNLRIAAIKIFEFWNKIGLKW